MLTKLMRKNKYGVKLICMCIYIILFLPPAMTESYLLKENSHSLLNRIKLFYSIMRIHFLIALDLPFS